MIYLFRHGEDDMQRIGGWSDATLTEFGEKQVRYRAMNMYYMNLSFDKIISSDIKRAIASAELISEFYKSRGKTLNIYTDRRFREQNKGIYNGIESSILIDEATKILNTNDPYYILPNGESLFNLYTRIEKILPWLLSLDNTLIVTHRGVINMLYYILYNVKLDMKKERFGVGHGSIHELDTKKLIIKKIA